MKRFILAPALFLTLSVLILSTGCINSKKAYPDVVEKCVELCKSAKIDLSNGPCLSNSLEKGWVCDVAHWPRQEVDNDPANQCSEYGKTADSFVEVDPECRPIRYYSPETGVVIIGGE